MPSFALRAPARTLLYVIAAVLFLDSLAQSITFPILPRLAASLLQGDAPLTALWVGWLESAWALTFLFTSPVLGALSDRFGRRPLIALSLAGVAAELIIDALAPNLYWLLAGRVVCGLTFAAQIAAFAAIADRTPPEKLTGAYGMLNGALYAGIIFGPLLGGWLAETGLRRPFWAGAAIAATGSLFAVLLIRETPLKRVAGRKDDKTAGVLAGFRLLFKSPALWPLTIILFLSWLAFQSSDNMVVLYTAHRYAWSPSTLGLYVGVIAAVALVLQSFASGHLAARLGDMRVMTFGFGALTIALAGMGLSPSGAGFALFGAVAAFGTLARPALQSLMAQRVGDKDQGLFQGAIASVASLTSIVAPLIFTQLYAWSISDGRDAAWSGATFIAGALLSAAALVAAVGFTRSRSRADIFTDLSVSEKIKP